MLKYLIYFKIIFLISFFGCTKNDNRLFWVDDLNGENNGFMFLAESTNIKNIEKDSLKYYLTNEEIAFNNTNFKVFQTIHKSDKFVAKILLNSKQNNLGRNYTFEIRTYSKNHRLIDKIEFACWNENEKIFCFGSIFDDLKISKTCDENNSAFSYQINNAGSIIQLNKNIVYEQKQVNNFELMYSIDGISLDKLDVHPTFRIKDSIFTFTNEQIWILDSDLFDPIEPTIIKYGKFRKSSRDSIIQIMNSIKENKVIKIHDEHSFWMTHNLSVSNGNREIKFEVDYSFDSPVHEILGILNSYIPKNDDKLDIF